MSLWVYVESMRSLRGCAAMLIRGLMGVSCGSRGFVVVIGRLSPLSSSPAGVVGVARIVVAGRSSLSCLSSVVCAIVVGGCRRRGRSSLLVVRGWSSSVIVVGSRRRSLVSIVIRHHGRWPSSSPAVRLSVLPSSVVVVHRCRCAHATVTRATGKAKGCKRDWHHPGN